MGKDQFFKELDEVSPSLGPAGTEHILIIDEEAATTKLYQIVLQNLGYQVTAFNDSIGALNVFRSQQESFDLVFSNHAMPKLNGTHLYREVFKLRENIPFILTTDHSCDISKEDLYREGIKYYFMKPLKLNIFTKKLREILDESIEK